MSIFFGFFVFILGLLFGSFLNVLIDRLPNDKSILGRSHCDNCKKTLGWKDLIPIVSFAYLKGRCRYCNTSLSYQYPAIELLTGLMFIFTFFFVIQNFQLSISNFQLIFDQQAIFNEILNHKSLIINLIYYLLIVSAFIVIFFADLKYGIIPDKVIVPAVFVSLVYLFLNHNSLILNHLLSALGSFAFFLFIYLLTKGKGMGFGDVKLSFLLGLILGFPGIALALYIAFLTGGVVGFILILWKKKSMKFAVPFGPFLILGAFISLFFQNQIIPIILGLLS